jgi:hypothetical protein
MTRDARITGELRYPPQTTPPAAHQQQAHTSPARLCIASTGLIRETGCTDPTWEPDTSRVVHTYVPTHQRIAAVAGRGIGRWVKRGAIRRLWSVRLVPFVVGLLVGPRVVVVVVVAMETDWGSLCLGPRFWRLTRGLKKGAGRLLRGLWRLLGRETVSAVETGFRTDETVGSGIRARWMGHVLIARSAQ